MKQCSKCKQVKPYSDYNSDKTKPDGYYSSCKSCKRLKDIAWEKKNPDKVKTRLKRYLVTEKGKQSTRRNAALARKRYPLKKLARDAVYQAVNKRKKNPIMPPEYCSDCKRKAKVFAHHHNGYEKEHWLDVVWLCQSCHSKQHS